MKRFFYLLLIAFIAIPFISTAQVSQQRGVCGTEFTEDMKTRLLDNIRNSGVYAHRSGNTIWVPVVFHLVADDNGNGRISRANVLDALCLINANYADQTDLQFYLYDDFQEIDNTVIYNHTNQLGAGTQMQIRKNNNALNIFIGNTAGSSGTTVTLGYYSPSRDIIYAVKSSVNANNHTLTHEIGHFFDLPHVFNGWEGIDYAAQYGTNNPPPNAVGGVTVERADGSNCASAGDFFCDTPPDYNLGLTWNNCNYTGGAVDPTGAVIDPDEGNFMSYFDLSNCIDSFSQGQINAMIADYHNNNSNANRVNIRANNTPVSSTTVSGTATHTLPVNGNPTLYYDFVGLEWSAVPNATHYVVQISRFASFSIIQEEATVMGTSYVATTLDANRKYYWKVRAFNDVSTCTTFSTRTEFTTGGITTGTKIVEGVQNISLQPNFANAGQSVRLNINADRIFDASINVYNLAGQVMQSQSGVALQNGLNVFNINTATLEAGMYIVTLESEFGVVNKKMVITK